MARLSPFTMPPQTAPRTPVGWLKSIRWPSCAGWTLVDGRRRSLPDSGKLRRLPSTSVQPAQLGQRMLFHHPTGVRGAVCGGIVNGDNLAIPGQADVQFGGIGIDFGTPGVGEGRK